VFRRTGREAPLLDLFDGHRQLIVQHFMWLWDEEQAARAARPDPTDLEASSRT